MLFYRQFDPCGPAACASCAALVIIGEKGGTSSQGPSARYLPAHQGTQQ